MSAEYELAPVGRALAWGLPLFLAVVFLVYYWSGVPFYPDAWITVGVSTSLSIAFQMFLAGISPKLIVRRRKS